MAQALSQLSPFEAFQVAIIAVATYLFFLGAKSPEEKGVGFACAAMSLLTIVWGLGKLLEFIQ